MAFKKHFDIYLGGEAASVFADRLTEYKADIITLFSSPDSFNFIKQYMFCSGRIRALPWERIIRNKDAFDSRASHTVSLFLLGISAVRNFGVGFDNIPHCFSDPYQNFLYLWSTMCLCHDIGYYYENDCSLARRMPTVYKFIDHTKISFNLLEVIDDDSLAINYYSYRINKYGKIDHGIAGGLLIYDRLMRDICRHKGLKEQCILYLGDTRRFGDSNIACVKIMSHAIMRHNMWFDDSEEYRNAGLHALMPKSHKSQSYKYCFKDNPLVFLLCLLDTIEPIKRGGADCLMNIDVVFDAKSRKITITPNSNSIDTTSYFSSISDLKKWLKVDTYTDGCTAIINII